MFHFSSEIDWHRFFRYDKRWITDMQWASLPAAAKAVLPVIACHCNELGEAFPGEEVVGCLSGRTGKTVRQGIRALEGFSGFGWEYYITKRGRRSKRFHLDLPPKGERNRAFFFYRVIIDSGIWSELLPTAQALYPVMRYFARYEADEEESLGDKDEFSERYAQRNWELCSADIGQLARFAGIDRHGVKDAMKNLTKNFLIESYEGGYGGTGWTVYLTPNEYWKASYLNQKLRSKAGA